MRPAPSGGETQRVIDTRSTRTARRRWGRWRSESTGQGQTPRTVVDTPEGRSWPSSCRLRSALSGARDRHLRALPIGVTGLPPLPSDFLDGSLNKVVDEPFGGVGMARPPVSPTRVSQVAERQP